MTTPEFDKASNTGFCHLVNATTYWLRGFRAAFRYEGAFRQEAAALVFIVPSAVWLGGGPVQIATLLGVYLMVLVVEPLNCGIEAAVDHAGPDHHHLAARAKGPDSAAVFGSLAVVGLVWDALVLERLASAPARP